MAKNTGVGRASKAANQGGGKSIRTAQRSASTGEFVGHHETQVEAVMAAAQRSGLLHEKSGRIGGRVSPALIQQAKTRTGIATDTDLIEFALANVALEDRFAETFKATRGKVDRDLKLGF